MRSRLRSLRQKLRLVRRPIPFHRWYLRRFLHRRLARRFVLHTIHRGDIPFYALDCSPNELREIKEITAADLSCCLRQLMSWCKPKGFAPSMRVYCIGQAAPRSRLLWPARIFLSTQESALGSWDGESRAIFCPLDDHDTLHAMVVHELTHAWLDLAGGPKRCPNAIEEGLARSIERMFGFHPACCPPSGWSDPALNLAHYWGRYRFFGVRDLLDFEIHNWFDLNHFTTWAVCWEFDALLAWLSHHIRAPIGLNDMISRFQQRKRETDGRMKWIARTCCMSIEAVESDFRDWARSGGWVPYVPVAGSLSDAGSEVTDPAKEQDDSE